MVGEEDFKVRVINIGFNEDLRFKQAQHPPSCTYFHGDDTLSPVATNVACPSGLCSDFDSDCANIKDHLACFRHDPGKGRCPFLANNEE